MKPTYVTKAGYEKLRAELDILKGVGRQEAARAIGEAREKGDLSENAEYDAAKDAQGMLESKIAELDLQMATIRFIDETSIDTSKVSVLTSVTIKNVKSGTQKTYKLVPETEADLKTARISVSSPMGQGLLGKVIGETADVQTPTGMIQFEVMDITVEQ